MTKTFLVSLIVVLVLGVSWGGAFAGGVALGKSQSDDNNFAGSSAPLPFSPRQRPSAPDSQQPTDQARPQFGSGQPSQQDLAQLRQRLQSGEINPEDLAQLRQRFQSGEVNPEDRDGLRQQFSGQFGQGFPRRGGVTGTIERVEGNMVTVETAQGPQTVIIGEDTVIQKSVAGTLEDLKEGVRIAAIGQLEDDPDAGARLIILTPEGTERGFGGGFFGGRR